ncbi:hypothetical protein EV200_10191 [Pedobacter psychrotolerans]|uniref:Lipocalin-like protein n=1 Tax=Pedobacter psychrotolerans TaxID=1843235 RepID=A0A4R2HL00_9SPHI|nr:hypothetical protein [Pedobacter psychrotolerans]TCO30658.1 hypothetical protein EV200_10191 [Pedobacter psychrotolerans]GGE68514.1 hypothetical protein GCM10011413_38980 [Pedobacter psychrotolerans]
MKKLTILMLCIATLGLASCKKDTIVQNNNSILTVVRDVPTSAWVLSNDRNTFTSEISVPEIDQFHIDNEGTLVYISYNNGASYIALPFVYNTDAFSYEVYQGGVAIDVQSSDYQATQPRKPTSTVRIKIVLVGNDL